jgi:hypothetical protein
MADEPTTSFSARALMRDAADEIDRLRRMEAAEAKPAASPVMSGTYGGNPYPIPAEKPASIAIPPAPAFDTDLREYVRVITQEDIGKHCVNVSDGRRLLVEIDRLNKLVADLTNEKAKNESAEQVAVVMHEQSMVIERLTRELAEAQETNRNNVAGHEQQIADLKADCATMREALHDDALALRVGAEVTDLGQDCDTAIRWYRQAVLKAGKKD